ncbi:unnamed protein product [Caretta caretta]
MLIEDMPIGDDRINRLRQAAELYLLQVVEDSSYVGIVTFNNEGEIRSQLRQIVNKDIRKELASYLPTAAPTGGTNVCVGLQLGFEVIKNQEGNIYGSEIILLTAGEDSGIIECFSNVINSGSIIHTIAFGPSAAKEVEQLAHETGGLTFFASDRLDSNDLIDGFSAISSGSGDTSSHSIQIESAGERTESCKLFSRTVTIDSTVGKDTFFVVTWQTAEPPKITLLDPNGKNYTNKDFEVNTVLQVARLQIPGIAEVGEWTYALMNTHLSPQALTMTVTSRAANSTIPAITVKAHMSSDRNEYPRSMVVYARVSQGLSPILGANVTAIIKPGTGDPIVLGLLDNGAGSDIVKNDGVYSRYIYSFSENGRYNLKVCVQRASKTVRPYPIVPWSHSMYIPGYIENGKIQMNPPRPSVISNEDIQTRAGGFSRTASGGSFIMSAVPTRPHNDVFPPCKIIDLHARTANDMIILSWTASGDDLDQGQAASYEIRTSESPLELRDNFDKAILVNTSDLTPQHAGYKEIFVFKPEAFATENITIIYVAVRAIDKASLHSDVSNIAQAVKFVLPMDYLTVRGSMVQLKNGGYEDIVIAINPGLPENDNIIRNIKDMVKEASSYLFNATKQRFFFKAVKIIIPLHWLPKPEYLSIKTESYDKADVIVANPFLKYGDDPYTLQYGRCGEKGRYIHFTPDFLLNDNLYNIYGPRAKVFVHEWAHLRWGVFDEYNNDAPFYVSTNSGKASVEATRCSASVTGKYIVQSTTKECKYDEQTKLYEAGCKFVPNKIQNAPASIMYMQNLPSNNRINRLYQSAEIFLLQIVEMGSWVGMTTFQSTAQIKINLQQIVSENVRQNLIKHLPTSADGGTNICEGVRKGFEMIKQKYTNLYGSEIVLLTDGEDTCMSNCLTEVEKSGSIIHTIALGPNAAPELEQFSDVTGGLKFYATDTVDSNGLIDAFSGISSGSGNISEQSIQLESTARSVAVKQWMNGTVTVDSTVGNDTFFVVTWDGITSPLDILLRDPKGKEYRTSDFTVSVLNLRTARLNIAGTAEVGDWYYWIQNNHTDSQVISMIVTSRAASLAVPPVTVKAHMNKDTNNFPNPMVIYAEVSQGFLPVLGATVMATVEPQTGSAMDLKLLDDGSGADITKNDGIYSKYFTSFKGNGRYNLKVRVQGKDKTVRLGRRQSRALYIPGYIENGEIKMNAPRPEVSDDEIQAKLGSFNRVASGGSFVVEKVPSRGTTDVFPPCKIIDLEAQYEENKIHLSWTAPGNDFDVGQAERYIIKMSESLLDLRNIFENATSVNTSSLVPNPAGTKESFQFKPENFTIENGTIIYFAICAIDNASLTSEVSNIAQAALFLPPKESSSSSVPGDKGSDIVKNDSVYSRNIYSFFENGRYNLKVCVQRASKTVRPHPIVPWSHSMYIPGYTENVPMVKSSTVQLKNGGYEDIVIAINPELPEDHNIIRNIQAMIKEASTYLFHATKQRFFFKAVKIIIPLHWLPKPDYLNVKTESYDKADVIVANPFLKYGDDPYTLQYGGCGEKGRYIHFTPDFLLKDNLNNIYGSRAKVFVHEWAHLRWGVFDEYNNDAPFYVSVNSGTGSVEATRCSGDITGKYIVQSCTGNSCTTRECKYDQQTKLYEAGCKFVPDKTQNALASIMYMQSLPSPILPGLTDTDAYRVLWDGVLTVSAGDQDRLELPLTLTKFSEALHQMLTNKSPDMDGLTVEFYRVFWDILSPDLAIIWAESLEVG